MVGESKRPFGRTRGNWPWDALSESREWAGRE